MAFLTIIAPLVAMTYPIDKITDGKAQAFNMWLKEYIYNALIQPFHLIIYTVMVGTAMDLVERGLAWCFDLCNLNPDMAGAVPTALMKPLSGSGARGLMLEAMTTHGADSLVGRLCCVLQGTTDTTFYVLAVYFGSINIKHTRHAVACCLLADLAGAIAAFVITPIFFG